MDYRIYFIGSNGRVAHRMEIECESDEAAVEAVEQHRDGRDIEVWQLGRLVKKIPKVT